MIRRRRPVPGGVVVPRLVTAAEFTALAKVLAPRASDSQIDTAWRLFDQPSINVPSMHLTCVSNALHRVGVRVR